MQSISQLAERQLKKACKATGRPLERGFGDDQKILEDCRAAIMDVTGATHCVVLVHPVTTFEGALRVEITRSGTALAG